MAVKRNKLKTFTYYLLALLLLLAVLEVVSRLVLHTFYNRGFSSRLMQHNKYYTSSGLYPNASATVWSKNFTTNAWGCRSTTKPYAAGKKKWLFIGDSVTEGVGVEDSATFTSLVAEDIAFDSVNVLNLSLIGYSTTDYYNALRAWLAQGDTTITRATIFLCLNDVYGATKTANLPVMAQQNWKGRLNALLQDNYQTYKLLKLLMFKNSNRYYQYDAQFYAPANTYFNSSMQVLQSCDSLCRAHNIALNVVMLPYRSQLSNTAANTWAPQNLTADFCTRAGIPFTALRQLGSQKPVDYYLFADEIHFNEKGHQAVAHFLLSH